MVQNLKTTYILLGTGSVLVALSGTLVGEYAFKSNIAGVFLAYSLFVIAYKTCWYGAKNEESILDTFKNFKSFSGRNLLEEKPWTYLMMPLGVYLAAHGTLQHHRRTTVNQFAEHRGTIQKNREFIDNLESPIA